VWATGYVSRGGAGSFCWQPEPVNASKTITNRNLKFVLCMDDIEPDSNRPFRIAAVAAKCKRGGPGQATVRDIVVGERCYARGDFRTIRNLGVSRRSLLRGGVT
jgi:hypothetical protein